MRLSARFSTHTRRTSRLIAASAIVLLAGGQLGCSWMSPKASNPSPMVFSTTRPAPTTPNSPGTAQSGTAQSGTAQPPIAQQPVSFQEFTTHRPATGARFVSTGFESAASGSPGAFAAPGASAVGPALVQHTTVTEGGDSDIALCPAGQWMAFTSTRHSERAKIYLQRVDGSAVIQLTSDESDDAHPTFSPDGTQLAFASNRSGPWKLYLTDLSGTKTTQLTQGGSNDIHPSFSPDGRWITYSSLNAMTGQWEIWLMSVETGQRRFITTGLMPVFSPDRGISRIAFQKARQRGSRWYSIWTIDLVAGDGRNPTEIAVSADSALVSPAWSPDGSALVFSAITQPTETADPLSPVLRPASQDLWVINADGTNRRQLTRDPAAAMSPFWAAGNRIYFVSDRSGNDAVWSVAPANAADQLAGPAGQPSIQPSAASPRLPRLPWASNGTNTASTTTPSTATPNNAITTTADPTP